MNYTVWVGGVEVNDNYVNEETAKSIANYWESHGYDDVVIETIEETNESSKST
jgi:hypothetical protein